MNITDIKDKLDVSWHPDVRCVLESWTNLDVELEEFRKAVFVKGINHSKASQGQAWIFDASKAQGSFNPAVQGFIDDNRFDALAWVGAKYFITVNPAVSEMTLNPDTESSRGIQRVEAPSADAALAWLRSNPG